MCNSWNTNMNFIETLKYLRLFLEMCNWRRSTFSYVDRAAEQSRKINIQVFTSAVKVNRKKRMKHPSRLISFIRLHT